VAYIPNCSDPVIQQQIQDGLLPSNICDYPTDILVQICERQPSLCQPYGGAVGPSIWEPVTGTVQEVGERLLKTTTAIGTGALGTLDLATMLVKVLPLILVGYGVYVVTKR